MINQNELTIEDLGWDETYEKWFEEHKKNGYEIGRVFIEHKHMYRVFSVYGELLAEISGKFRYQVANHQQYPVVGDWVALQIRPEEKRGTIHAVLPRKSKFSRKAAGPETEEQIAAANFDTVFLVSSLNKDLNVRRLERYLILAWESGANPVIILTKADLCPNVEEWIEKVEAVAVGVPIHAVSSTQGDGLEQLRPYLQKGKTVAILGSSGVGKSTLINRLAGSDMLQTQEIRLEDDRGRHTTTHRQLLILPQGGLIMDTPGMRELQLWEAGDGVQETFGDVEALAKRCRFADCTHEEEPGCVIRQAIEEGTLERERFNSYRKLQKELRYLEMKQKQMVKIQEKRKGKQSIRPTRNKKIEEEE